jgi:antitoxin MazE
MKTRLQHWGNVLAVRIPKAIARAAGLNEGDPIDLSASEDGRIEIRRVPATMTLAELVGRITPENRHEEIFVGKPTGKEPVDW